MPTLQELKDQLEKLEPEFSNLSQKVFSLRQEIEDRKNEELFNSNLLSTSSWELLVQDTGNSYSITLYARQISRFHPDLNKCFHDYHETIYFGDELHTRLRLSDNELFLYSDDLLETIKHFNLTVAVSDVSTKLNKLKKQVRLIEEVLSKFEQTHEEN